MVPSGSGRPAAEKSVRPIRIRSPSFSAIRVTGWSFRKVPFALPLSTRKNPSSFRSMRACRREIAASGMETAASAARPIHDSSSWSSNSLPISSISADSRTFSFAIRSASLP
jgi:hypothetical protein